MQFLLVLVARYIYTSSFARFARSATSPSFAYQGAGQLSVQSCCSPIASACPPPPPPPPPDCVRSRARLHPCFNCCSPFASASSCCSPIAPASATAACSPLASASAAAHDRVHFTAAPRLRPLRLLLPQLQRQLDCSP